MVSSKRHLFEQCRLVPVSSDSDKVSSTVEFVNKTYKTSCFYLDSSGRACVSLPLELQFGDPETMKTFLAYVRPVPSNQTANAESADEPSASSGSIAIEAKVTLTFGTGQAITAKVEGVTILSTELQESSVIFNTEIILRVSGEGTSVEASGGDVKAKLEITAALTEIFNSQPVTAEDLLESLRARNIGESTETESSIDRVSITKLPPVALRVALTNAVTIAVRSVPGPQMGQTFLALALKHSNTHQRPVTITSIALHPGVTVTKDPSETTTAVKHSSLRGDTQHAVIDMSNSVQWGYVNKCGPNLPLTLHPHESFSTILSVDASNDTVSRMCYCPLSVTALIGKEKHDHHRHQIVVAVDAKWMTARSSVEPADTFRIEMSVGADDRGAVVGAPLAVDLEIFNLSSETRNLMLLVDNNNDDKKVGNRWTIISEKEGSKFGVGVGRENSVKQDLLPVDNALLLGDIRGHSSTKTQLRVLLLREGTVDIPNFKLVDIRTGRRYSCIHKLKAVVNAA